MGVDDVERTVGEIEGVNVADHEPYVAGVHSGPGQGEHVVADLERGDDARRDGGRKPALMVPGPQPTSRMDSPGRRWGSR